MSPTIFLPNERMSALCYDPARPLDVLAWPFLTFVAVLMISFVVQSLQFDKPGRTMAKIAGTILVVAYVGLLGSFTIQMRWFEGRLSGPAAARLPGRDGQGGRHGCLRVRPARRPPQALAQPQPEARRSKGPSAAWCSASGRGLDRRGDRPIRAPCSDLRLVRGGSSSAVVGAVAQLGDLWSR